MIKIKLLLIFILIFVSSNLANSYTIEVKIKVNNEIITNIDIDNEKKYLIFLNSKLSELDTKRIDKISKDSLITEIIKRNELKKVFDLNKTQNITIEIEKQIIKNKNLSSKAEFIDLLEKNDLNYNIVKRKLQVETLWNQLILKKYINNVKIDKESLKKGILDQYNNKEKIFEYNLSEIVFKESLNKDLKNILNKIQKNIDEIGFENTANIYSISNTSKNGGLIGWVNELQISEKIKKNINEVDVDGMAKPIKMNGGYLIIKVNDKRVFKEEIDIDKELNDLINKEKNRQLNAFSIIFYKRLKKNISINEL